MRETGEPSLAEMEFEPFDGLDEMGLGERGEAFAKIMELVITVLGKSKPELIELVSAMAKDAGESLVGLMLKEMGEATADLETMLDLVGAARLRVASAAANVFPEMAAALEGAGRQQ
jgi:hypothetical protein